MSSQSRKTLIHLWITNEDISVSIDSYSIPRSRPRKVKDIITIINVTSGLTSIV